MPLAEWNGTSEAILSERRVIILCFNHSPSPRQWNTFRLFEEVGQRPGFVVWDRSPDSLVLQDPKSILATIHLRAPTESPRLLLVMPRYWLALSRLIREEIRSEAQPPILVATHLFQLPLVWRFTRASWFYDSAEYYAWDVSRYFGPLGALAWPILRWLEGLALRPMRGIFAVDSRGGWFESQLRRFNVSVRVVPNLPALADDGPWKSRIEPETKSERRVICYVGGLLERKGIGVALRALALLKPVFPNLTLLLVGPGWTPALAECVDELGLTDQVEISPPLPYREMVARIAGAEIGLALHQPESPLYKKVGALNGRKIFTYMQTGMAIVAPCFGEIGRAVVETGCGVLVDTKNPEAVAQVLRELLFDPDRLGRLRHHARRAFEDEYNWERAAREIQPWLEHCLKEQPGEVERE